MDNEKSQEFEVQVHILLPNDQTITGTLFSSPRNSKFHPAGTVIESFARVINSIQELVHSDVGAGMMVYAREAGKEFDADTEVVVVPHAVLRTAILSFKCVVL